jgi:hypothetical protein
LLTRFPIRKSVLTSAARKDLSPDAIRRVCPEEHRDRDSKKASRAMLIIGCDFHPRSTNCHGRKGDWRSVQRAAIRPRNRRNARLLLEFANFAGTVEPPNFYLVELTGYDTFWPMKRVLLILGLIFFVLGIVALVHPNFDYHKHEEVARIGPITATVDKPESAKIPVPATVALLVSGLVLVVLASRAK